MIKGTHESKILIFNENFNETLNLRCNLENIIREKNNS